MAVQNRHNTILFGFFFSLDLRSKSHNLIYLFNNIGIKPPVKNGRFIVKLNEASIPTRYPENLLKLQEFYNEAAVKDILTNGKEVVKWIKRQL
ncbi:MAG: HEPN domain-containing protein [Deltaproteobacteria bacterium]|nr:HEPN domain-containing protein [Deltaproteobacteria bacterium]